MALRFGTDGVRGVANAELTPELALALGRAAARVLGGDRVVIGRDTRRSGPMLEARAGRRLRRRRACDVELLGVVPTPAVAYLSDGRRLRRRRDLGLAQPVRRQRHQAVRRRRAQAARRRRGGASRPSSSASWPATSATGRAATGVGTHPDRRPTARRAYVDHLVGLLEGRRARRACDVVLDCANGAAHARRRPRCSSRSGADVDGDPRRARRTQHQRSAAARRTRRPLADAVAVGRPTLGLAFDGDADRVIAVDHTGAVVDGDQIIAICALDLHAPRPAAATTPSSSP